MLGVSWVKRRWLFRGPRSREALGTMRKHGKEGGRGVGGVKQREGREEAEGRRQQLKEPRGGGGGRREGGRS